MDSLDDFTLLDSERMLTYVCAFPKRIPSPDARALMDIGPIGSTARLLRQDMEPRKASRRTLRELGTR